MWFTIWVSCGRPRTGCVYDSYKLSKKQYRQNRRRAQNSNISKTFNMLDGLLRRKKTSQFWNVIRNIKRGTPQESNEIDLTDFTQFYKNKFTASKEHTDTSNDVDTNVSGHYAMIKDKIFTHHTAIQSEVIQRYIQKLKIGCSPGIDGIMAEHLKHANSPKLNSYISSMLDICLKYGVVPDSFSEGLLIPILKKPNLDPSNANNYRPIVISTTLAKLFEIHMLEACGTHEFHDLQFGFIPGRGTAMASALAHDVFNYCVENGSPVYVCSLDAEGAFDAIPHHVLFQKTRGIIPDIFWRCLVYWYARLQVRIRWNGALSIDPVYIFRGTRQGGLSSPFLFNLFYQDMLNLLDYMPCGIQIDECKYNVFCYADDILLSSLTCSGLQDLIDTANKYVCAHGLKFNPNKSICTTFGKRSLKDTNWNIDGNILTQKPEILYLGVLLSNDATAHATSRINSAKNAFYALQGAGLCNYGLNPQSISTLFRTIIQPCLLYGLNCVHQNKGAISKVNTTHNKLLKTALGLRHSTRSTPLVRAMGLKRIDDCIEQNELCLFKTVFLSNSRSKSFYSYMYSHFTDSLNGKSLLHRVIATCKKRDISLVNYICDNSYSHYVKNRFKPTPLNDGVVDSVTKLLERYDEHDKYMLNLLLRTF